MGDPHGEAGAHGDESWLYHLPGFLDRVRDIGAHSVRENLDVEFGGVLYHHRGARVPAHDATFVWSEDGETFDLELDAVGDRSAWVRFDADREWDFFLTRASGDAPCLAWMTDDEFQAEEADEYESKQESVGLLRFSFGIYLQSPDAWLEIEEQARDTDAACFVYRPGGRTLVPEEGLEEYAAVLPPELLPDEQGDGGSNAGGEDGPPNYLGVVEAQATAGQTDW